MLSTRGAFFFARCRRDRFRFDRYLIGRIPKRGGAVEVLAGCAWTTGSREFAVDDGWLYWRSGKGEALKRAPM